MFKIFLIYHSHIDIGFTERQEKIANYQADFIRQAVDLSLSDKQKERSDKNKFKFTAEGFWAIEQYLKRYGEEGKQKLLAAIHTGCFELTAGYFHMAELLNYPNLSHSLDYSSQFAKENTLEPIDVAMSCDVNGFSWGYADALYDHGVRYLSTNINTHHGYPPFRRPLVPFWWETPKGRKILVWNGLTYHKANLLGLIPGLAPGGNAFIPGVEIEEREHVDVTGPEYAHGRIEQMVTSLKTNGYPYHFLPIMGSGLYTDNSPCSDDHCALIEEWNRKYDDIEIVTATQKEFFHYLLEHGGQFDTFCGDWNDWWTDGVMSTPTETRLFRNAQRVNELTKKLDPEEKIVTPEMHEKIENRLITYAEHTWGHSAVLSDPFKLLVAQDDARKAKLAFDADVMAGEAFDRLTEHLGEGEFTCHRPFRYRIINPHHFEKKDVVYLPVDFWEEGRFSDHNYRVVDENGSVVPSQKTATLRGAVIACEVTLAPSGQKELSVEFLPDPPVCSAFKNMPVTQAAVFENDFYRLSYDKEGIHSILFKETGEELLDTRAPMPGAPVYQIYPNGKRGQAAGFGYQPKTKPKMEIHDAKLLSFTLVESGDVFTHLTAEFSIRGALTATAEYYFYHALPKIMVCSDVAKQLIRDPEGMYISLPLQVRNGEWHLDKAGAFFKPGKQLPGGCYDYYPVNRGLVLSGDKMGLAVNSLDTPLVAINRIKLWDYTTEAETSGPLYFWMSNNKWECNFRSQCSGDLEGRYVIEFSTDLKDAEKGLQVLESNEYDLIALRK